MRSRLLGIHLVVFTTKRNSAAGRRWPVCLLDWWPSETRLLASPLHSRRLSGHLFFFPVSQTLHCGKWIITAALSRTAKPSERSLNASSGADVFRLGAVSCVTVRSPSEPSLEARRRWRAPPPPPPPPCQRWTQANEVLCSTAVLLAVRSPPVRHVQHVLERRRKRC